MAWQVPAATITAVGIVLGISLRSETSPEVQGGLLFLMAGFVFVMLIQMGKHRLGLDSVATFKKYVFSKIKALSESEELLDLPIETKDIIKLIEKEQGWLIRDPLYHDFLVNRRAYFWMQYFMFILFLILILSGIIVLSLN